MFYPLDVHAVKEFLPKRNEAETDTLGNGCTG
jgi:hypothetical protein